MGRTINEERGARRAAELKKRFSRVSKRSLGSSSPIESIDRRLSNASGLGVSSGRSILIWVGIGLIAFVGFSLLH
ncbi:MAG: hypothetical protein HWE23_09095 [Rhodobacteraceae bacterium]|nr:hypothetical protein [Paracoccaceae bacterium]